MSPQPIICILPLFIILSAAAVSSQLEEFDPLERSPDLRPTGMAAAAAYPDSAALDSLIAGTLSAHHIPGLSACLLKDGLLKWTGSYGYADIEQGREVSDSTLFYLASISKTVTATAVMQLWEDGRFDLDDDINAYLPPQLQLTNPLYPDDAVTFRMLLAHTSSIDYDWSLINSLISWGSDCPIPLESFLIDYFMPGGSYYSHGPFAGWAPGSRYQYCNQAFALLGYLVEAIAGTSLETYCRENIFLPLGMDETSWFLSELDLDRIAVPYKYSGGYVPYGHYGLVVYPAAQLRTSAPQLARYLAAYMRMGELDGYRILDSATVDLMTSVQYPGVASEQGLAWRVHNRPDGSRTYEHPGEVYGCRTQIGCHDAPEEDTGLIVLANGESGSGLGIIWDALWEYAMLYNKIYPTEVRLSSSFMRPDADTLLLTARFVNHSDHAFSALATVTGPDSAVAGTVGLFDDGQHGDGLAGDGMWANSIAPQAAESEFIVAIGTTDTDAGGDFTADDLARFTTIGPVFLDHYQHTLFDTVPNPGDLVKCRFVLRNAGSTAAAEQVTSTVTSLDSYAYLIDPVTPAYGDIAAGDTAAGDQRQYFRFADDCPDSVTARFRFDISSHSHVFWTDTLSFFVVHHHFSGAAEAENDRPGAFVLRQNYPNPFNPQTTIGYRLPAESDVELAVYNLSGQRVALLVRQRQPAGSYQVQWQAGHLASGLYLCLLKAGDAVQTRKLVLLK